MPGTWLQLAIVQAATGEVIGDCGLHCLARDPTQREVGITLAPEHQGQRYAAEALDSLLTYAFSVPGTQGGFAVVDVLNQPAIALCRRLGLTEDVASARDVIFKGAPGRERVFAVQREAWTNRPPLPLA